MTLARSGDIALNGLGNLNTAGQRAAGPNDPTSEAASGSSIPVPSPVLFDNSSLSVDFHLDSSSVDFDGYGLSGVIDSQEMRLLYGSRDVPPDTLLEEPGSLPNLSSSRDGRSSDNHSSSSSTSARPLAESEAATPFASSLQSPSSFPSTPQNGSQPQLDLQRSQPWLLDTSSPSDQGAPTSTPTEPIGQAYTGGRPATDQSALHQTSAVPRTRSLFGWQSPASSSEQLEPLEMQARQQLLGGPVDRTPPAMSSEIDWRVKVSELAPDVNDAVSEFAALTYTMMQQPQAPLLPVVVPAYVQPRLPAPSSRKSIPAPSRLQHSRPPSHTAELACSVLPQILKGSPLAQRMVNPNLTPHRTKEEARKVHAQVLRRSKQPASLWMHDDQAIGPGLALRGSSRALFQAGQDRPVSSNSSANGVDGSSQRDTGRDQSQRSSSSAKLSQNKAGSQHSLSRALSQMETLLQNSHAPAPKRVSKPQPPPSPSGQSPSTFQDPSRSYVHTPPSRPSGLESTPVAASRVSRFSTDAGRFATDAGYTPDTVDGTSSSHPDPITSGSSGRNQAVRNSAVRSTAYGSSSNGSSVTSSGGSSSRAAVMSQYTQSRASRHTSGASTPRNPPPRPPRSTLTASSEGPSARHPLASKRRRQQAERRLQRQLERSLLLPDPVVLEGRSPYPSLLSRPKLNPSELSLKIKAAKNLRTLRALHTQHITSFHLPHVTMVLRRLTTLRSQGAIQPRSTEKFDALWSAMLSRAFFMSHKAKPHHAMYTMLALTMSRQGTAGAERAAGRKPTTPPLPNTSNASINPAPRQVSPQPDLSLLVSSLLEFSERHLTHPAAANGHANTDASSGSSVGSLDWASTDDSDAESAESATAVVAAAAAAAREHLPAADATRLIVHIGKMGASSSFSPPASWMRAMFAGSLPLLHTFSTGDLVGMLHGISVMRAAPPAEWLASFYTLVGSHPRNLVFHNIHNKSLWVCCFTLWGFKLR